MSYSVIRAVQSSYMLSVKSNLKNSSPLSQNPVITPSNQQSHFTASASDVLFAYYHSFFFWVSQVFLLYVCSQQKFGICFLFVPFMPHFLPMAWGMCVHYITLTLLLENYTL